MNTTEGGHIKEFDDTKDNERIHERHTSGSGFEIHPDGSKVTRVKKDNYEVITNDNYLHIQGISSKQLNRQILMEILCTYFQVYFSIQYALRVCFKYLLCQQSISKRYSTTLCLAI